MKLFNLRAAISSAIFLIFLVFNSCQKSTRLSSATGQTSPDPTVVRSWFENTAIPNEKAAVAAGRKALVQGAPLVQHPRLAGIDKIINWDNARSYGSGSSGYLIMPFNESLHPFVNKDYEAARAIVFYTGANNTHQFKIVEAISDKGGQFTADIRDVAAAAVGKAAQPVNGFDGHVIVYDHYYFREAMYTYTNGTPGPGNMSISILPGGIASGSKVIMSTKTPMITCSGSAGCTTESQYITWYSPSTGLDYVYTGPYDDCSGSGYGSAPQIPGYTIAPPPPAPPNSCTLASSLEQNSAFNTAFTSLGNALYNGYESAFMMNAQGVPGPLLNGGPYGENFTWSSGSFNNTTGYVFNHEYESSGTSSMFNFEDMTYLSTAFTSSTIAGSPYNYTFAVVTPDGQYLLAITDYSEFENFAWAFSEVVNSTSYYNLYTAYNYYINIYNSAATNEVNFIAFMNEFTGGTGLTLMKWVDGSWQTVWYDDNDNPTYTPC